MCYLVEANVEAVELTLPLPLPLPLPAILLFIRKLIIKVELVEAFFVILINIQLSHRANVPKDQKRKC